MKKLLPYILIVSLLTNCSPIHLSTLTPTIVSPTSTATQPPVLTATNTVVPTGTPEIITNACYETKTEIPRNDINGTIVLNGAFSVYDKPNAQFVLNPDTAYLWDVKNNTKIELPHEKGEELSGFSVSPNKKFLLYAARGNAEAERATVVDTNGKIIRNVVNGYNWFFPTGWLNDDQIAIWMRSDVSYGVPFPTLIYNPFTKDTKFLMPNYSNIYNWHLTDWADTLTVYDPSLSFVIYPVGGHSNVKNGIALWDLKDEKQVAFLPLAPPEINARQPIWSSDGQKFIIGAKLENHQAIELYMVTSRGEIKQLTNFEELVQRKEMTDVELWDYSWSNDGHFITVLYRPDKQGPLQLTLLDVFSGQLTNLCITTPVTGTIVWSPDNTQFLITHLTNKGENIDDYRVLLVDIKDSYIVEIAKGVVSAGWLKTSP